MVPADQKLALHFGFIENYGHGMMGMTGRLIPKPNGLDGFPWSIAHLDGGLLVNGRHPDVVDGKVFWTYGGNPIWLAFFWWDRSGDRRANSNSGFYVRGFSFQLAPEAFAYAGTIYPKIVERQRVPLVLQP